MTANPLIRDARQQLLQTGANAGRHLAARAKEASNAFGRAAARKYSRLGFWMKTDGKVLVEELVLAAGKVKDKFRK